MASNAVFLLLFPIAASSLLLVLLILAYVTFFHRPLQILRQFRKQGVKGPPFRPFVGQLPEAMAGMRQSAVDGKPLHFLTMWQKMYGDVFYYMVGTSVRLAIMNPELGYQIQSQTSGPRAVFQKDAGMAENYEPILGKTGLVMASNDVWPRIRKMATPAFYHARLQDWGPMMVGCIEQLVQSWDQKIDSEGGSAEIEVWGEFTGLARDILCGAVFGDPRGATAAYSGQDIYGDFSQLMRDMKSQLIPGYKYLPTATNRRIARLRRKVHDMLDNIIQARREAGVSATKGPGETPKFGDDLLGRLLAASDEQGSLSAPELMDQCKTFFFAGHETTSTTLAWTLLLLAQNPEWANKARQEIRTVCGDTPPDGTTVNSFKVLNMIVQESLRLFPPLFLASRQACSPTAIDGLNIPADPSLSLFLPIVLYHHDPRFWGDDADEFRPERFLNGTSGLGPASHAYSPFSTGPRTCIGQHFAMQESKLVLATLLQKFSFEVSPGYKHAPNIGVTLTPKYGVQLIVRRRAE